MEPLLWDTSDMLAWGPVKQQNRDQANRSPNGQFVSSGSTRYYELLQWDNMKYTTLLFLHTDVLVSFFLKALKLDCCLATKTEADSSATPGTVACQTRLSMAFPRQEYCSALPFPTPGDLPHPEIEPVSPASGGSLYHGAPWEALNLDYLVLTEISLFKADFLAEYAISQRLSFLDLLGFFLRT